jgi:pSer/pThr/pTyr-binding forkhead associated (FHA) protein
MVYRPEELPDAKDDAPAEVAREVVTLTIGDRVVPVTSARVVVGRSREADVQVEDSNVSRRHCEVAQENAASWSVTDLGSTNGTELNGQRITGTTALADGDRITVGGTTIVFGRTLP